MENKNILTVLRDIFGQRKPGQLTSVIDIQKNLQQAQRSIAVRPLVDPTVFSNKGLTQGALFTDSRSHAGQAYVKYTERETLRNARYYQYDKMDADLLASALDVYANEATQRDSNRKIITVSSDSQFIKTEIDRLLNQLQLNGNKTWSIIRNMCKYGDSFCSMTLDSRQGVIGLKFLDVSTVYRIDDQDNLQGYIQDLSAARQNMRTGNMSGLNTNNPYVNYNVLNMPMFTTAQKQNEDNYIMFKNYEILHFKVSGRNQYDPYGFSVLDPAVDAWKKLDLLSDSLIIYRINKAPARYVFYVDTGGNQGGNIDSYMQKTIDSLSKKDYYDAQGKINERYQLLDMNANIFVPLSKNAQNSRVDLLQGASNVGEIEDVKYFNDRLFSALKVPKAFLGFEGDVSGKGMLSQQNVTFSKSVQNIQEDFLYTLRDLCLIHLGIKGITDKKALESFTLTMTTPSYIEEQARINSENERLNLATSYKNFGVDTKWTVLNILGKTEAEFKQMFPNGIPAPGAEAGLGGLGGLGGGGLEGLGGIGQDFGGGGIPAAPGGELAGLGAQASEIPLPAAGGGEPLLQHTVPQYGNLIVETSNKTHVTYDNTNITDVTQLAMTYKLLSEHFAPANQESTLVENQE